jgi:hypothetical protein
MACPPSNVKFQLRRALASQWLSTPSLILQAGEPGYETDTFKLKIGDGMTPWYLLPYIGESVCVGITGPTGPSGTNGTNGVTGPTGPVTSYIFDGGTAGSDYILGPAFDCGSST